MLPWRGASVASKVKGRRLSKSLVRLRVDLMKQATIIPCKMNPSRIFLYLVRRSCHGELVAYWQSNPEV